MVLIEQTLQDLRTFKLTGMAEALSQQLTQPKSYDLSRLSLPAFGFNRRQQLTLLRYPDPAM